MIRRWMLSAALVTALAGCHGISFNSSSGSTSQSAVNVIGQSSFTESTANMGATQPSSNTLNQPYGRVSGVAGGPLYVPDQGNNRILGYSYTPQSPGAEASFPLGQDSFTTSASGTTKTAFNHPGDTAVYNSELFLADTGNNRVLVWNFLPQTSSPSLAATGVVGQPDFTSYTSGDTATTLDQPASVFAAGSKLFVADTKNNRVLIYKLPLNNSTGQSAAVVIGQSDFTSSGHGTTASQLYHPEGVWSNGTQLIIADTDNNRVLIYNTIPTRNGANANVVLGQPDFTSNGHATSKNTLDHPKGVFVSNGKLYVADTGNNRVLIYNNVPTSNQPDADKVLGQQSFDTNSVGTSDHQLYGPTAVSVVNSRLYVTDTGNNRVMVFNP